MTILLVENDPAEARLSLEALRETRMELQLQLVKSGGIGKFFSMIRSPVGYWRCKARLPSLCQHELVSSNA